MAKLLEYIIFAETVETPMGVIHTHGFAVFEAIPAYKMAALEPKADMPWCDNCECWHMPTAECIDRHFDAEYDQRFEEAKL